MHFFGGMGTVYIYHFKGMQTVQILIPLDKGDINDFICLIYYKWVSFYIVYCYTTRLYA